MEEARGEEEELTKGGKTVTRWLYFCATFLLLLFSLPSSPGRGREGRKGGTKRGGRGGEREGVGEIGGE